MKILALVVFLVALLIIPAVAYPTYTATPGGTGGTYGSTGIPCVYYDETGIQLFDGDYGKWDWIIRQQPLTDEQYLAHYEDQKGYAYPWVCWTYTASIIIDAGSIQQFNQVGLHMYQGREIGVPSYMTVSFSNNGTDFSGTTEYNLLDKYSSYNDEVFWVSLDCPNTEARYARIYLPGGPWQFVDEISINGLDGAGNPVPEPSSFVILGTLLTPLLFRRRQ